jgi:protein-tyrosine phosphatase
VVNLSKVPVKRNGAPTVVWPIEDGQIPDTNALWAIARYVADVLDRSQRSRVLVHCSAGRNRAALLGTLVVMLSRNVSGAEAIRRVRYKRPGALDNPRFERWLLNQKRPEGEVT